MSIEPKPFVLLPQAEIQAVVRHLASEITRDYKGKHPVFIGVLKGSFMFLADLTRLLDFPIELDFVRVSSYGKGCETSGKPRKVLGLCSRIKGRDVLIIEDIIDTGLTTAFLMEQLRKENPASVKLCVLLDKPSQRRVPITIDYKGVTAPDKFLVGYGIDWNEKFRNLPDVCFIEVESNVRRP